MAADLQVNVICARNLPAEWGESSDPYVVLKWHGKTHKTRADEDSGRNPKWNKTLTFPLGNPSGNIEVKVYDQDVGFDDFKGQCDIDIRHIMDSGSRVRNWFPLSGKKGGGDHGEIELELIIQYSEGWSEETAARLAELEKQEDRSEMNQMLAGVAGLAAAGVAAYAGHQAATGQGNKTTNSVIAGVAGAAALAAGGYAVSEHLKENKIEGQQEELGAQKHGWFD